MNDLNQVLDLIKAGDKTQARQLLLDILRADHDNEQAWLYMAACATSKHEFEMSLQQVLKLNPLNSQAIQLAEKQGIPLPAATKTALKQAKKGRRKKQAPPKGEKKSGGRGLRIFLLLLVILAALAGAGYAILNQGEDKTATVEPLATEEVAATSTEETNPQATEAATPEATEESAAASTEEVSPANTEEVISAATEEINPASTEALVAETTLAPTKTVAPKPTLTATTAPTATQESSPTPEEVVQVPTDTPTPIPPTLTPTSEFNFPNVEPNLLMVYTIDAAYLKNTSNDNLDISGLRFVQKLTTQEISFAALEWQFDTYHGLGSVYALQPGRCFQVGIENTPASRKPKECVTLNAWKVRDLDGQFWLLNDGKVRTFLVLQNETPIAECDIEAGSCEFGVAAPQ